MSAFPELDPEILERARRVRAGRPAGGAGPITFGRTPAGEIEGRPVALITERQIDVLRLAAHGLKDHEIAIELDLGTSTVKSHVKHAISRLSSRNRTHAVAIAIRAGLLDERADNASAPHLGEQTVFAEEKTPPVGAPRVARRISHAGFGRARSGERARRRIASSLVHDDERDDVAHLADNFVDEHD